MITDPISDMFVRIRNANAKLHEKVDIPYPGVDPIGGGGDEYVEGKSAVFDGGDSE